VIFTKKRVRTSLWKLPKDNQLLPNLWDLASWELVNFFIKSDNYPVQKYILIVLQSTSVLKNKIITKSDDSKKKPQYLPNTSL
jgi:hypothetical protein